MKIQWHTEMTVTQERINQQKHTVGWHRDTGSNMADRGGTKFITETEQRQIESRRY